MNNLKSFSKKYLENKNLKQNESPNNKQIKIKKQIDGIDSMIKIFEIKSEKTKLKNLLRKMIILKSLNHDCIINLKNSYYQKNHLFLQFENVNYNLKQVLREKSCGLTDNHVKYMFYQMVLGVAYLHSEQIEHLGLCPESILLTNNCDVKISGFKNANFYSLPQHSEMKSIYQDYYSSPESILNNGKNPHCPFKADIWALGCMFFEFLEKKNVLGYKRQYLDQLKWMFKLLGSPEREKLFWIKNFEARKWVSSLKFQEKKKASSYVGKNNACNLAKDLLDKMLKINPYKRISAFEILEHPYFNNLYHEQDVNFVKSNMKMIDFIACHPNNEDFCFIKKNVLSFNMK